MTGLLPTCPRCLAPVPVTLPNTGRLAPCAECGWPVLAEVFPALLRPIAPGTAGEPILTDGEAGCFHHPTRRAVVPCSSCGRFLCALCDLELNGRHLCPACLVNGQRQGRIPELEQKRILWDGTALTLATVPLLMWPATLITAPLAVGVAIYGWNKPRSLVPRTRLRAVLAILLGLAQMAGWGFLLYALIAQL